MVLFKKKLIKGEMKMKKFNITNKTVIITGASGGFGSELTKLFVNEFDCRVIGIGRSREKMEALAESLTLNRSRFKFFLFDVSDRENWRKFAAMLERKGIIPDLLINNAGIMPPFESFEYEDGELAKRVIDVNLMSVIYGCEAMIPLLKKSQQGGIVNIASSAAFSPVVGTAVYSASKGAVKNFSMALTEDLKGKLYVGTVCPGFSRTDLFRDNNYSEEDFDFISGFGTEKEEIAKSIVIGVTSGKKLIICGKDSRLMTTMSAVAPIKSNALYAKVLKGSKLKMFDNLT